MESIRKEETMKEVISKLKLLKEDLIKCAEAEKKTNSRYMTPELMIIRVNEILKAAEVSKNENEI